MPISRQFPIIDPAAMSRVLKKELEERWELQKFQEAVRKASGEARGTSYGAVWSYVNAPPDHPRPEVVQAMAEVLGIRFEYLATGKKPRTDADAERMAAAESDPAIDAARDRFWACLERSLLYPSLSDAHIDLRQLFGTLAFRIGIGYLADDAHMLEAINGLSRLLMDPFSVLCPVVDEEGGWIIPRAYLRSILVAAHEAVDVATESLEDSRTDELRASVISHLIKINAKEASDGER